MPKETSHIPLHPFVYYATRYPFQPGQISGPRICYSASIYLIEQGTGKLGMNGTTYMMKPGTLIYIPAGKVHRWEADSSSPMVHVCCYFDWRYVDRSSLSPLAAPICFDLSKLQSEYIGSAYPLEIHEITYIDKIQVWVHLFEGFYKSNELGDSHQFRRDLKVQGYFQLFLEHFLEHTLSARHRIDPRIFKLLDRMEQDILNGQLRTTQSYQEELQLSRGYFHEIFKKATGFTPTQYVQVYRISLIQADLLQTDLSVTELAEKHHFASIHYLSRLFHKMTGETPTEYRARNR